MLPSITTLSRWDPVTKKSCQNTINHTVTFCVSSFDGVVLVLGRSALRALLTLFLSPRPRLVPVNWLESETETSPEPINLLFRAQDERHGNFCSYNCVFNERTNKFALVVLDRFLGPPHPTQNTGLPVLFSLYFQKKRTRRGLRPLKGINSAQIRLSRVRD